MRSCSFMAIWLVACGGEASSPADTAGPSDSAGDDTADVVDTVLDTDEVSDTSGTYIEGCQTLFAARIVERQRDHRPSFPLSCDAPLATAVGLLRQGGSALCVAGETANACRDRLYRTPPAMASLDPACAAGGATDGCLLGSFLPRCADGTDTCQADEVVCWDGTRPMIYAEAATAGPSDVWWFHMGGEGGPCSGATCWPTYRWDKDEFRFAMSSLHPDGPSRAANRPGGVLSGDTSLPYARVNRVRFERCGDAASDTTEVVPFSDGVPAEYAALYPGAPPLTRTSTTTVHHRGFNTWRAAFAAMTTNVGRDRDGDGTPELPSLADARLVILSGSSDASMWVTIAADRLADEIRAIAGDDVEVRLAVDGMFPPMLDNEARYHPDMPANFDMLSMPYSETGLCRLDDNDDGLDNEACSDANYRPGGNLHTSFLARGLLLDASCQATHGAGAPECFDRNHTLVHHLDVPVIVLADQEDNTVSKNAPSHADDRTYGWGDIADYRKRVVDQGWDLVDYYASDKREEGPGAADGMVLILPKTRRDGEPLGRATHVRFGSDEDMAKTMTLCTSGGAKVATASYHQMFAGWLTDQLPTVFAIEDARRSLPNGNYWVTGSSCRAPE